MFSKISSYLECSQNLRERLGARVKISRGKLELHVSYLHIAIDIFRKNGSRNAVTFYSHSRNASNASGLISVSVGGGFGGKESRNCFLTNAVAVAAAR